MRDIVVFLVIIVCCVISLRRPYYGLLCWVWLSLMSPHRLTWGWMYSFPAAQLTFIFMGFGTILYKEKARLFQHGIPLLQIVFLAWIGITTLFAFEPIWAYPNFDRAWKIQVGVLLSYLLVDSREKINGLLAVMFASVGFFGVKGGIFTILTGGSMKVWGPPGSFIEDNNHLALALLMTLPIGFYLLNITSNKFIKYSLISSLPIIGLSILGSSSRGAFLGLITVVIFWMRKASGTQKILVLFLGVFFVAAAVGFMPDSWWERMNTVKTYEKDGSAMGRINAWWCAFNLAKDSITGGGFGYYSARVFAIYAPNPTDVHAAHSIYFQILGEHGFIGLILFILIGGWSWITLSNTIRMTENISDYKWANDLARMMQLSLVAYFSAGSFLSLSYYDFYWQLIALSVILKRTIENEVSNPVPTSLKKIGIHPKTKTTREYPVFVRPISKPTNPIK